MKRYAWRSVAAAWLVLGGTVWAAASARPETTVLVVPADEMVLRVANDAAARFGLPLVVYQTRGDLLTLHVAGPDWTPLPLAHYQSGAFLPGRPARAFVVSAGPQAPDAMFEVGAWDQEPYHAVVTDTASMVNALGATLGFRRADWRHFASRHGLEVRDLSEPRRRESWYTTTRAEDVPPLRDLQQERATDPAPPPIRPAPALPPRPAPSPEDPPRDREFERLDRIPSPRPTPPSPPPTETPPPPAPPPALPDEELGEWFEGPDESVPAPPMK